MRKTSLVLSAIASLLLALAFILFFIPAVSPYMPYGFATSGLGFWGPSRLEFLKFFNFAATYGSHPIMWVFLLAVLAVLALWIAHLVAIMKSRRPNSFFVNIVWLIAGFLSVDLFVYGFLPGLWATKSITSLNFGTLFESSSYGAEYINYMTVLQAQNVSGLNSVLPHLPYVLGGLAAVFLSLALILSFFDMRKNPGVEKKVSLVPPVTAPIPEANPAPVAKTRPADDEQYRQTLNEELAGHANSIESHTTVTPQAYQGPQPSIIQYINYGSGKGGRPMDNGNYITKDELGKIIHEELSAYLSKDDAKPEETVASNMLTSDDLREIIREEMSPKKALSEEPAPAPEGMKASEVRQLIAEEIAKALAAEHEAEARLAEEREAHRQALEDARDNQIQSLMAQLRSSNEEIAAVKGSSLRVEEFRTIISQELDRKFPNGAVVAQVAGLFQTPVAVAPTAPVAPVIPAPVTIAPLPVAPVVASVPGPAPVPTPAPVPAAPVAVAPVVAPAPVPAPAPLAPLPEKPKIIRIPFPTRMVDAEKELKSHYNELKAEALSYGLKSRVSNSGDTFRLHTKTYLKISIAGKGLKIYYALDPKDYANGPIPMKDASNKNIYKEIPGCFKVKSDLSLKRAKQLIADACGKDKLVQDQVDVHNFAAELKDYKPQGGDDDDDGDDDEN